MSAKLLLQIAVGRQPGKRKFVAQAGLQLFNDELAFFEDNEILHTWR